MNNNNHNHPKYPSPQHMQFSQHSAYPPPQQYYHQPPQQFQVQPQQPIYTTMQVPFYNNAYYNQAAVYHHQNQTLQHFQQQLEQTKFSLIPPAYNPPKPYIFPKKNQIHKQNNNKFQHGNGRFNNPTKLPSDLECKNCEKKFQQQSQLDAHLKSHVNCTECDFVGLKKFVDDHITEVHKIQSQPNMTHHKKKFVIETEEEIKKYIEDRKKKYPTDSNVSRKLEETEAKKRKNESKHMSNLKNEKKQKLIEKNIHCPVFVSGNCTKGQLCEFLHEIPSSISKADTLNLEENVEGNNRKKKNNKSRKNNKKKEHENFKVQNITDGKRKNLLKMLLEPEIKRERNIIFQFCKYLVKTNFLKDTSDVGVKMVAGFKICKDDKELIRKEKELLLVKGANAEDDESSGSETSLDDGDEQLCDPVLLKKNYLMADDDTDLLADENMEDLEVEEVDLIVREIHSSNSSLNYVELVKLVLTKVDGRTTKKVISNSVKKLLKI
ncbi:hypothetical protein HK099_001468 [Clydaea vesicula]|uniref:C3H1-type domain-containing protein n=1 Tax=Clydaea vesicula TaxID=447962 RepID=A0AAD5U3R4_9FUNG|nr:hypothetical protein HK099_001468 [Clydaea vesicula]